MIENLAKSTVYLRSEKNDTYFKSQKVFIKQEAQQILVVSTAIKICQEIRNTEVLQSFVINTQSFAIAEFSLTTDLV